MNLAGFSVVCGLALVVYMALPYSLVLLLGLVWLFRK